MNSPNPSNNKHWNTNLQQFVLWSISNKDNWHKNLKYASSSLYNQRQEENSQRIKKYGTREVTKEAINIVAETVVTPFPLVATWKRANKSPRKIISRQVIVTSLFHKII